MHMSSLIPHVILQMICLFCACFVGLSVYPLSSKHPMKIPYSRRYSHPCQFPDYKWLDDNHKWESVNKSAWSCIGEGSFMYVAVIRVGSMHEV